MLKYAKKFLDVVIVGSTYKRNRFNPPLVNIVGINNLGFTIFFAFALISDEKIESYEWIFRSLKKAWKSNPINFVCDECASINKGKFFLTEPAIIFDCRIFLKFNGVRRQSPAYFTHYLKRLKQKEKEISASKRCGRT